MRKMYDRGRIVFLALPKDLPDRNDSPDPRGPI